MASYLSRGSDKKAKWKAAALASDAADGGDDDEKNERKLEKTLNELKLARRTSNINKALAELREVDVLLLLGATTACLR